MRLMVPAVTAAGWAAGIDQSKWGGVAPLWRDVVRAHEQRHLHAMVGGGDQVYTDGFFKVG